MKCKILYQRHRCGISIPYTTTDDAAGPTLSCPSFYTQWAMIGVSVPSYFNATAGHSAPVQLHFDFFILLSRLYHELLDTAVFQVVSWGSNPEWVVDVPEGSQRSRDPVHVLKGPQRWSKLSTCIAFSVNSCSSYLAVCAATLTLLVCIVLRTQVHPHCTGFDVFDGLIHILVRERWSLQMFS